MRDQFVADVSDLRKLAFLRSIVPDGSALGVAWYYVAKRLQKKDGKHREYMDEPKWQALDAPLHDHLKAIPEHSVKALQALPVCGRMGQNFTALRLSRRLVQSGKLGLPPC